MIIYLIMVIEPSGVQFGLKSYVSFESRTSAQVRFEISSMISDQNCTTRSNFHFIRSIMKSHNLIAKFAKQWLRLSFDTLQWDWLVLKKSKNRIGWFVLLSHSFCLRERLDFERKIVQFMNKSHRWELITLINRTAESQSHCKDNQWFHN